MLPLWQALQPSIASAAAPKDPVDKLKQCLQELFAPDDMAAGQDIPGLTILAGAAGKKGSQSQCVAAGPSSLAHQAPLPLGNAAAWPPPPEVAVPPASAGLAPPGKLAAATQHPVGTPAPQTVQPPASAGSKPLEEYEQEAKDSLSKRGAVKQMKRPAAAKAAGKAAAKASSAGTTKPPLKLGCKKCRGTPKGCDQCRRAGYSGLRLNKEEWLAGSKKYGWK